MRKKKRTWKKDQSDNGGRKRVRKEIKGKRMKERGDKREKVRLKGIRGKRRE